MTDPKQSMSTNRAQKDAAAIRIFPPAVPLLPVLAGIALGGVLPVGSNVMLQAPLNYWVGGGLIIAVFYLLGFNAVRAMRLSGQSENPYKKTTEVVEAGPYRFTRNPMYLQMVLICVGLSILMSNIWIFVLTPFCALALQILVIRPEESYLERKFGNTYLDYKSRVRRWI